MSTNLLSKKVLIIALFAVGAVAAALVASSIAQATAQQEQQTIVWQSSDMPKINGSVSVTDEASSFINENAKVSFVQAAQTAQTQVQDGRVLGGHLGVAQGYLVYTFFVVNSGNQTGQMVIVDAGNGDVLYTSVGSSFGSFGPMLGQWGGHGYGGWGGPWNGHGWGMWH